MKYKFILNPKAGKKKDTQGLINLIHDYMDKSADIEIDFAFTRSAGDATHLSKKASEENFDYIVAVGGDGTVNEVANGLIKKRSVLGIIPLGSGNGIARSMKIPQSIKGAVENLLHGESSCIDIGQLNGRNFIGIAGTGYDALIGNRFQSFGPRGPIPYFVIGAREFFKYHYLSYSVNIDGESIQTKALMLTFANTGEYGNGAVIAPDADPADGYLDFCMLKPQNIAGAIRAASMLFHNNIDKHPGFVSRKCQKIMIQTGGENMFIHRDGEPDVVSNELIVEIIPKALNICLPMGKS